MIKTLLNLFVFLSPTILFCQKSGEIMFSIVDSTIIEGFVGDMMIELVDGKETILVVGPEDIGRSKEWNRDTTKGLFTQKEVVSFYKSTERSFSGKEIFWYHNFKKMKSYHKTIDKNGNDKVSSYRMFEDLFTDGVISEFKIDRNKSISISGVKGFWIAYFLTKKKKVQKIQGYVTESIQYPFPMLPPKKKRLKYTPLDLSIEALRLGIPQRKTTFKLLSYRKAKKRKIKRHIAAYKGEIRNFK